MSKENLQFAVSSMSSGEYRPSHAHQVLIPRFTTEQMIRRTTHLRDRLEPAFGRENITISLHPGTVIDVPRAIRLLQEAGLPISSIDAPSIYTNRSYVQKMLKNLLTMSPRELKLHTGWRLQNVGSEKEKGEKLDQGLRAFLPIANPQIVRTDAGAWNESRRGEELRKKLRDHSNAVIAIEIDAGNQTPDEYVKYLQKLAEANDKDVPVYADLDLGHFGESKYLHGKQSEIPDPLEIYERLLKDKNISKLVALTSLNQYKAGELHTHVNFMRGPIDFAKAAKILGNTARQGRLPFSAMTVAEFYPMEYEQVIDDEALEYWKKVREAFDAKA